MRIFRLLNRLIGLDPLVWKFALTLSFRNFGIFLFLISLLFSLSEFNSLVAKPNKRKKSDPHARQIHSTRQTIILSIDGFPSYYWRDPKYHSYFPHLVELFETYGVSEIQTVNPSVTYPAHTSMVTGKDPGEHGIFNNTLSDPFEKNDGGWMWYAEDILVPTLWDLANQNKKTTANVFWPVTVGANINWNLPQYWRKKIPEDDKILRVISTNGLHKEAELAIGSPLNDVAKDEVKLKTATWLFQTKKPSLMFVYTTDLDTMHHGFGPGSEKALVRLAEIDTAIFTFLKSVGAFTKNSPNIVIVSDHGFFSAESVCAPNVLLKQKGYINDETGNFHLTFKSSGGISILLPGTDGILPKETITNLVTEITNSCPGAEWLDFTSLPTNETVSVGENTNQRMRSQIHPRALGILLTKQNLFFSGTRKGDLFQTSSSKIHGHGYWNENSEMKTIGFVYDPTGKKHQFHSVKDVFFIVKEMLGLKERKTKGPSVPTKP